LSRVGHVAAASAAAFLKSDAFTAALNEAMSAKAGPVKAGNAIATATIPASAPGIHVRTTSPCSAAAGA
jgi:hypothetical protein